MVIETGGADLAAPGPINAIGEWLLHYKQVKLWQEDLRFILSDMRQNIDPNVTEISDPLYDRVDGEWQQGSPTQSEILNNVCQASWCN